MVLVGSIALSVNVLWLTSPVDSSLILECEESSLLLPTNGSFGASLLPTLWF